MSKKRLVFNQACLREHRQAVEVSKLLADAVITVSKKRLVFNQACLREHRLAVEESKLLADAVIIL